MGLERRITAGNRVAYHIGHIWSRCALTCRTCPDVLFSVHMVRFVRPISPLGTIQGRKKARCFRAQRAKPWPIRDGNAAGGELSASEIVRKKARPHAWGRATALAEALARAHIPYCVLVFHQRLSLSQRACSLGEHVHLRPHRLYTNASNPF